MNVYADTDPYSPYYTDYNPHYMPSCPPLPVSTASSSMSSTTQKVAQVMTADPDRLSCNPACKEFIDEFDKVTALQNKIRKSGLERMSNDEIMSLKTYVRNKTLSIKGVRSLQNEHSEAKSQAAKIRTFLILFTTIAVVATVIFALHTLVVPALPFLMAKVLATSLVPKAVAAMVFPTYVTVGLLASLGTTHILHYFEKKNLENYIKQEKIISQLN